MAACRCYNTLCVDLAALSSSLSLPSLLMKWRFENRISKQMEAIKKVGTIWNNSAVNSPKVVYIRVVLDMS